MERGRDTVKLNVTAAEVGDAEAIHSLAVENNTTRDEPGDVGFVELQIPDIETYERLISDGQIVLVSEGDGGEPNGFVLGYENDYFIENVASHSEVEGKVAQVATEPYIYLEQLVVAEGSREMGVGTELITSALDEGRERGYSIFWGAVAHKPRRNNTMIQILTAQGFELMSEVETDSGLTFGLYRLHE